MNIIGTLLICILVFVTPLDQSFAAKKLNINTATAREFQAYLKGVGLKKAQAIVSYRKKNGAFKNINDLTKIKGISKKTIKKNIDRITVLPIHRGVKMNR